MIATMFLSLPHCGLDIFSTEKRVNYGGEHGLKIPADIPFYVTEKTIKLGKKIKIEELSNDIAKHCLK